MCVEILAALRSGAQTQSSKSSLRSVHVNVFVRDPHTRRYINLSTSPSSFFHHSVSLFHQKRELVGTWIFWFRIQYIQVFGEVVRLNEKKMEVVDGVV
jgi:hypothetical protein